MVVLTWPSAQVLHLTEHGPQTPLPSRLHRGSQLAVTQRRRQTATTAVRCTSPLVLAAAAYYVSAERSTAVAEPTRTYITRLQDQFTVTQTVEKDGKAYVITVSVPASALPSAAKPQLIWGTYRTSPAKWFHPKEGAPPGSTPDARSGGLRSPLQRAGDAWQLQLRVPAEQAPLTVAFQVQVPASGNRAAKSIAPRDGGNFCVPVGMHPGEPSPLGLSAVAGSPADSVTVNFAVRSRAATAMSLCLARRQASGKTGYLEVALDPKVNRTGDTWHVRLLGLKDVGTLSYGWRADAADISQFYPGQLLLDPYAHLAVDVRLPDNIQTVPPNLLKVKADADKNMARLGSLAALTQDFDWRGAARPSHALEDTVILEVHPPTFNSAASGRQGQLLSVLDRLEDIKAVGATTVMLTPIAASGPGLGPFDRAPVSFFAPDPSLAGGAEPDAAAAELKQLVAGLHREGIEVLLQVQYSLTAEGTHKAPNPQSLLGLDGDIYYRPGGVLNCGHAVVRALVRDSLLHLAAEYRVDGFCFINAETLTQDREGNVQDAPALADELAQEPALRGLKLLAWAADDSLLPRGGARGFPHWGRWAERNKRFTTDVVRWFAEGVGGPNAAAAAARMEGSADLFNADWDSGMPGNLACGRRPAFSLNMVSALSAAPTAKVVDDSLWSYPPFQDAAYGCASHQQSFAKALLVAVTMSAGMPGFTQADIADEAMARFVGILVSLRRKYQALLQPLDFSEETFAERGLRWHGAFEGSSPNWEGGDGGAYQAFSVRDQQGCALYVGFSNAGGVECATIPAPPPGTAWHRVVDTGLVSPADAALGKGECLTESAYWLQPKSAIVLEAERISVSRPPVAPFTRV